MPTSGRGRFRRQNKDRPVALVQSVRFEQSYVAFLVTQLLRTFVEEGETLIAVGDETAFLDETNEHLRPHHQREESVVSLVATFEKVAQLKESLRVGRTNSWSFSDGQKVRSVALQSQRHETQEGLLDFQFLRLLNIQSIKIIYG